MFVIHNFIDIDFTMMWFLLLLLYLKTLFLVEKILESSTSISERFLVKIESFLYFGGSVEFSGYYLK